MNTFARIKHIGAYDKVSYYSVVVGEGTISLFEKFIATHQQTNKDKLYHIVKWIQVIGEKYGAQAHLFRPEGETADTSALPPAKNNNPSYIENGKKKPNALRLYCLRANQHVVFLFNGDLKTAIKAQECENVRDHFKLANQITAALDEAFKQKNIKWNETFTDIEFLSNLIINF
ncbi:hypothetical protein IR010_01800 [Flavobacterium sp. MR2016-29]|uniref:hypothetical protein n=1 Tax=Flavobacterium sp. MR2016-29 TaxID=2783795 RepID=UPI00188B9EB1|nr:hypothetical protein [Flavobacterium sp. MR2016-29]MBF4491256.1 hypothetical protein [Flavobacterium sp. MR2016-29]